MADFDLVKVIDRYFQFLEKGPTLDVLRVKIGSAVLAAPSSKSVTKN